MLHKSTVKSAAKALLKCCKSTVKSVAKALLKCCKSIANSAVRAWSKFFQEHKWCCQDIVSSAATARSSAATARSSAAMRS